MYYVCDCHYWFKYLREYWFGGVFYADKITGSPCGYNFHLCNSRIFALTIILPDPSEN